MMVEEAAGGQTLRGRDGVVDLRLGNVNVLRSKLRRLNLRNSKYSYINVSIIEKLFQLGTKKTIQIPEGILMEKKEIEGTHSVLRRHICHANKTMFVNNAS